MVKFGDSMRQARREEWNQAYLDYDRLKAVLSQMEAVASTADNERRDEHSPLLSSKARSKEGVACISQETLLHQLLNIGNSFSAELDLEIEKVTLFTLKKQGQLAEKLGALRFCHSEELSSAFVVGADQDSCYDSTRSDKQARNDYTKLGVELLHLLRFICINATGIRKILKKYEKTVYSILHGNMMFQVEDVLEETAMQQMRYALETRTGLQHAAMTALRQPHYNRKEHSNFDTNSAGGSSRLLQFGAATLNRNFLFDGPGYHLKELANSASVSVLQASLELALLQQAESEIQQLSKEKSRVLSTPSESLLRFQFVMASIDTLRQSADAVNSPFSNFLSRKAMIVTGTNLGGIEGSALEALQRLLRFEPDTILYLPHEALVEWYETMKIDEGATHDEPVEVLSVVEQKYKNLRHRRHRRKQSHMDTMMLSASKDDDGGVSNSKASTGDSDWGGVDSLSLGINLLSTLLYTVNYYIVAPNANHYAILLGHDGAFGATLIGASSFAALFAAFVYSFWYTQFSFKSALIFSSTCPMVGNMMYSLAVSYKSMPMALWGRILCGFGSAEVVNRQLISTSVSFERLTRASASFVAVGAAGMSIGPLLGSIFDMVSGRDHQVDISLPLLPAGGVIFDHITGPGFFMSVLWLLQLLMLMFFFDEPERINVSNETNHSKLFDNAHHRSSNDLVTPYGSPSGNTSVESFRSVKTTEKKLNLWGLLKTISVGISSTSQLIFENPGLPVTLLLFCYIEMADEVLISSCSMVCRRYFGWHGSRAGLLIASLGALVLPADFVVERASHYLSERKIMKNALIFIMITLVGITNFEGLVYDILGSAAQIMENHNEDTDVTIDGTKIGDILNKGSEFPYDWDVGKIVYVIFLSAIFMGTIILEGVVTSLMAKVTPAKLNDAFINSGLMATLIGTLGRVFADLLITTSALIDFYTFIDFVNATFFPLLLLAWLGFYLVKRNYKEFLIG